MTLEAREHVKRGELFLAKPSPFQAALVLVEKRRDEAGMDCQAMTLPFSLADSPLGEPGNRQFLRSHRGWKDEWHGMKGRLK